MRGLHTTVLALALAGLGASIFFYKIFALQFPLLPKATENTWTIEGRVSFLADGKPASLAFHIPRSSARASLLDESFISQGFGLTTTAEDLNRTARWAIRSATGKQTLYYHAVVRPFDRGANLVTTRTPELPAPSLEESEREAASVLLNDAHRQSADLRSSVAYLASRLSTAGDQDGPVKLLLSKRKTAQRRLSVLVDILALGQVSARVAHGIRLEDVNRDAPVVHWLEAHNGKRWLSFDGVTGEELGEQDLLAWWWGSVPIAKLEGGSGLSVRLSVKRRVEAALERELTAAGMSDTPFIKFSLFSLPIETQAVYRVLLLVPLGGLLVALLRNVVGLETFGTFMPVLIALAFREMDLLKGVALFSLIVALGLLARGYLDRLNLLLVPRLAAILTIVVLVMAALSVFSYHFHIEHGISIALFPMVILTMTIERMSIVIEEVGVRRALKQGIGSLAAAALTTLLMQVEVIEHLLFAFPELLLAVLALCILLGRYTGYRLLELFRFRGVVKS